MLPVRLRQGVSRSLHLADLEYGLCNFSSLLGSDWGSNISCQAAHGGVRTYADDAGPSRPSRNDGSPGGLQRSSWQPRNSPASRPDRRPQAGGAGGPPQQRPPRTRQQGSPPQQQQQPRNTQKSSFARMDLLSALAANSGVKPGKKGTALPASVEAAVASTKINSDMLPLLHYILSPEELGELARGNLSPYEHQSLLSKVRSAMERPPSKVASMATTDLKMMADPNYRLENALTGSSDPSPEGVLDCMKVELSACLGLSAAEFEELKATAVKEFTESSLPEIVAANPEVRNRELEEMVADKVPPGHRHYGALVSQLKVLQSNPNWPHERKLVFARRLLRQLA